MTEQEFLQIIPQIITACSALAGIIIGAVGTFLIQSRLQQRQRKWLLDDQRRQWKREQLLKFSSALQKIVIYSGPTSVSKVITKVEIDEFISILHELVSCFDSTLDEKLTDLVDKMTFPDLEELMGMRHEELEEYVDKYFKLSVEIQVRVRELLEQTYS